MIKLNIFLFSISGHLGFPIYIFQIESLYVNIVDSEEKIFEFFFFVTVNIQIKFYIPFLFEIVGHIKFLFVC